MRQVLSPILLEDDDALTAEAQGDLCLTRTAAVSPSAQQKAVSKPTKEDLSVHSFSTFLKDVATVSKNLLNPRPKMPQSSRKQHDPPLCSKRPSTFSA